MPVPSPSLSTLALGLALALSACGDTPPPVADKQAASAPPAAAPAAPTTPAAVSVSTVQAEQKPFGLSLKATGTVTPVEAVEVRPQIAGVIHKVHVREGQTVRAGDLLFTLDTRSDEANVAKWRAQIAKDEALLADAQRQWARSRDLLAKGFVAQGAVDSSQANVEAQQANLLADQASLAAAQVPLSYGTIRAAMTGRTGAIPVFAGSAVQANLTPLATITRLDPIDVAFSVPQASLPELLGLLKSGQGQIEAELPDNPQRLKGRLQFVDSVVDAASGTVKAKARFDNPKNLLWPGAFVKVALQTRQIDNAVVIPTQAIVQSPRGAMVYVALEGKAKAKPVQLLGTRNDQAAVSGITAGDKVVVDGRQNLRPDSPINERNGGKAPETSAQKPEKAAP